MVATVAATLLLTGTGIGPGARCTTPEPGVMVCQERLTGQATALALINLGQRPVSIDILFHRLGIQPNPQVWNVTQNKDWGKVQGGFAQRVEPRGSAWFRLRSAAD